MSVCPDVARSKPAFQTADLHITAAAGVASLR
eukprot:CAMPEP_0183339030 /NCGR_PEP_ID=MMETSP0164_2-20130417/6111_1 /TAXON_ID=221442 /ORGANISM="Coccolithus pelagicus ssp braarudi, Strain PLY182g" /LENGTH=31 /DNA_ID= /DNA_START= /DNA_END= /DNA_ORIENTATION=